MERREDERTTEGGARGRWRKEKEMNRVQGIGIIYRNTSTRLRGSLLDD